MPAYDFSAPRLFVDAPLNEGLSVALERDQSNYLGNVLRLAAGDAVLVFNGRGGDRSAQARRQPDHPRADAAAG
jgi:16S rRNA (uracil1498-N3)-methyltransferase